MIVFESVSIAYPSSGPVAPVLADVNLSITDGQLVLVVGRTGSGKSTLLSAINGHVPHFTGGTMTGRVLIDDLDTATHPPRDLAHIVGVVGQDPLAGFVTDTVEEELAYGMEQQGVPTQTMRARVEETLDILGLVSLRSRPLRTLSGGQQQRVAIGSVLASGVRVLVLDEPTSALDPVSSEEVLAALLRLVHDLGLTVVVAEHRLERVISYADQVVIVEDSRVSQGPTRTMMASSSLVPPVVDLARRTRSGEIPLSVREARSFAGGLREALSGMDSTRYPRSPASQGLSSVRAQIAVSEGPGQDRSLDIHRLRVTYGPLVAVKDISASLPAGKVTVLMGRNGSGKSSLMWALTGVQKTSAGRISFAGTPLEKASVAQMRDHIRLVPQNASDLLFLSTVDQECSAADREVGAEPGLCRKVLDALAPDIDPWAHPRDLSEGQKLCLVLAIQLTARPSVILLDEPTRGLDYPAKAALAQILAEMAGDGRVVGVVTHDVEFAAEVADQILLMATGEVIQHGSAQEVLATSALFAPQVAKVLHPAPWLTPHQVGLAFDDTRGQ